jgi:hypothetical protein
VGNDANLQTFVDARRFVRAKVANLNARNTLPSPQDGDLVLVLDNGAGQTQIDRYKASTSSWATVAVEGGGGGGSVAAAPAPKDPVRAATTGTLPANTRATNVLTASVNGALPAIDGVSLALGDRLLVRNEANGAKNGIYTVTSLGSASVPWSLARASDANTEADLPSGTLVLVSEGIVNRGAVFGLVAEDAITLNETPLNFARFGGGSAMSTPVQGKIVPLEVMSIISQG